MSERKRCAKRVYRGSWGSGFPCSNTATVEEDGKWWCRQHAPSFVAARRAKRDAELRQKWAAERAAYERKAAITSAEHAVIEAAVERVKALRSDLGDFRGLRHQRALAEECAAVDRLLAAREGRS